MAPVPALALGVFEVSPLELARAYAAFANGGIRPAAATSVRALYQSNGGRVVAQRDGVSRVVVRRETLDDLLATDLGVSG